jgi:predicted transposase YbfD/YdcC
LAKGSRVFRALEPEQFRRCFQNFMARFSETCQGVVAIAVHTTVDGDHGRIETWTSTISAAIDRLQENHRWPGLNAIGKILRSRETAAKTTTETAYYILSTAMTAERFGQFVRAHWAVENSLHWTLDVVMNDDQARNRLDHGPNNLAVLRHMALNILNTQKSKISNRRKIKRAGWSNAFLANLLAQI